MNNCAQAPESGGLIMGLTIRVGFCVVGVVLAACSGTTITQVTAESTGGSSAVVGTTSIGGTGASAGSGTAGTTAGRSGTGGPQNGGSGNTGTATGGMIGASGGTSSGTIGGATGVGATTGGSAATGGAATGGSATGGAATGGAATSAGGSATGGHVATGGAATGGAATGGAATGGAGGFATGGHVATGGAATGGAATGGAATGGAATGGAGTGGTPATWCNLQTIPSGVATADYQCVDFDQGLPSSSIWPQTLANSGTATLTNARASSTPSSLIVTVPSAAAYTSAATASMSWSDVGSTALKGVSLAADFSPATVSGVPAPWTGNVALLCVSFGSGRACLNYTSGADTEFQTAYTGYYIEALYTGGSAVRYECAVTATLTANLWTRVELRVTASSGAIQVFFGGSAVGTCTGAFDADTVSVSTVGLRVTAATTTSWTSYYDNVVAAVSR